jgi:hypothetical protein
MEHRRLLAIVKLPKPISEMSDNEIDAFAGRVFELMQRRMNEIETQSGLDDDERPARDQVGEGT